MAKTMFKAASADDCAELLSEFTRLLVRLGTHHVLKTDPLQVEYSSPQGRKLVCTTPFSPPKWMEQFPNDPIPWAGCAVTGSKFKYLSENGVYRECDLYGPVSLILRRVEQEWKRCAGMADARQGVQVP